MFIFSIQYGQNGASQIDFCAFLNYRQFQEVRKKCIRKGSIKPIQVSKHRSSVYGKKNEPTQGKKEKDRKKVKCDDGNDT